MLTVELVLLEKIPRGKDRRFLGELEARLRDTSSGLAVDVKMIGLTKSRLPRVKCSGDDQEAFIEILRRSYGVGPRNHLDLSDQPIRKGFVVRPSEREKALLIDIGLESATSSHVTLAADRLRAQLFDGRNVLLRDMVARCGFLEDYPLELRIISHDEYSQRIEAELSDRQQSLIQEWRQVPLDRVIAQNVLASEVSAAVKKARIERDLAAIENLSLCTHSLICKLGTHGRGIVPKLGPYLREARLFVFHPSSCNNTPLRIEANLSKTR